MRLLHRFTSTIALLLFAFAVSDAFNPARAVEPPSSTIWKIGTPVVTHYAGPGFPNGADATDATVKQMAEGGWNLAWCRERELDVLQRHGLRAHLTDPLLVPDALHDATKRAALEALVARVRTHPAMYSYHLIDEPSAGSFPAWAELVAFLRERDPAHLAYINLLPTYASNEQLGNKGDTVAAYREHLRSFAETVKPAMLSYDHYHFMRTVDNDQYFLNLAMVRAQAVASGVPFMNIVQASNWVLGEKATPHTPRVPDGDEMRFLLYTTLAYGGQGISYYVYSFPAHEGGIALADGTPTPLYAALSKLNREFTAIAAQVQPLVSLGAFHAGMMPKGTTAWAAEAAIRLDPPVAEMAYVPGVRVEGVLTGLFGSAGKSTTEATHALVVNLDYRKERAVTVQANAPLEVFDATTGAWSAAGGAHLELKLSGGGGRLVRLVKTDAAKQ